MDLLGQVFKKSIEKFNAHAKNYPADFHGTILPYDKKRGVVRYSFDRCPIADFVKKNGLGKWLPLMCNCDHTALRKIHAGLIREGTCYIGERCDYCIVREDDPIMYQVELVRNEDGLLVSRRKMNYEVIPAPDGQKNVLYRALRLCIKALNLKKLLMGTKEEVLARAAKINARNPFVLPADKKAYYTDHLILDQYHCLEIGTEEQRRQKAILFVFGGGMILGSDKGDIGLSRRIAKETGADVWFPYYPLCHEHDMLENVRMVFACYRKMLECYAPKNIVLLGFSSGGALILDLITYINERNDSGEDVPMPGLLIAVSPASIPVTQDEKYRLHELDREDVMIPESYMVLAKEIMLCGHDVDEKYLATAHGDFRNAPETHLYYGSAETVYAFAPSYAKSFQKAGAECRIHVGEGMHHCYALQASVPGCKAAFNEIMELIKAHFADQGKAFEK